MVSPEFPYPGENRAKTEISLFLASCSYVIKPFTWSKKQLWLTHDFNIAFIGIQR